MLILSQTHLSRLLRLVEEGVTVPILRRGVPMAR
jgi:antitoxin (DNA-binding transcriptional repressor) of toxin-antitoxin stability system